MTRLTYVPDRIIDHNGIADGATVYVYRSGTTTPVLLYSDSNMTVPLANPFTVAAGAAFPNVFYDSSVAIKLRIISSLDGTITEYDPYTPLSVSLTYPSVIWINVKNYGAVGDGVTDDTTAFQTALAYLDTIKTTTLIGYGQRSGTLFVPKGIYKLTQELVPDSAVEIYGESTLLGDGSVLKRTGSSGHGIKLLGWDGISRHATGSFIHNLHIKGWYASPSDRGAHHGIYVNGQAKIEDIFGDSWPGNVVEAYGDPDSLNGNVSLSTFRNIYGQNSDLTLRLSGGGANACSINNIQGQANRLGAYWDDSFLGNYATNIYAENNIDVNYRFRCEKNGHIYVVAYGQEVWCSTNSPSGTTASNTGWLYLQEGATNFYTSTWVTGQTWYFNAPVRIGPPDNGNTLGRAEGIYVEAGDNPIILANLATCSTITSHPVWLQSSIAHGGHCRGNGQYMLFNNHISVNGNIVSRGTQHDIGPTTGTADNFLNLYNTNASSQISFFRQGVGTADGYLLSTPSNLFINGQTYLNLRAGSANIAIVSSTGIDLQTGKILSVAGTKVVGPQGAAVADAAALTSVDGTNAAAAPTMAEFNALVAEFNKLRTDLGATRTQLNLALARLRASTGHGLIA